MEPYPFVPKIGYMGGMRSLQPCQFEGIKISDPQFRDAFYLKSQLVGGFIPSEKY